jgi:hypothetical protein
MLHEYSPKSVLLVAHHIPSLSSDALPGGVLLVVIFYNKYRCTSDRVGKPSLLDLFPQ